MKYRALFEVDIEEVDKIMERLEKAKEEIYECYNKLQFLEVVKFVKEDPASAKD